MTKVSIDYDCANRCRYGAPTAIPRSGGALRHASTIDTVVLLIDAQHDAQCPDPAALPAKARKRADR